MARYLVAVQIAGNQVSHQVLVDADTSEAARRSASVAGTVLAVYEYFDSTQPVVAEVPEGFWNVDPNEVRAPRVQSPLLSQAALGVALASLLLPFMIPVAFVLSLATLTGPHRRRSFAALVTTLIVIIFWAVIAANGFPEGWLPSTR